MNENEQDDMFIRGSCPHCQGGIEVRKTEINCRIFRHASFKSNGEPVPPHANQEECERWFVQQLIRGCGKPVRLDENQVFVTCDYI